MCASAIEQYLEVRPKRGVFVPRVCDDSLNERWKGVISHDRPVGGVVGERVFVYPRDHGKYVGRLFPIQEASIIVFLRKLFTEGVRIPRLKLVLKKETEKLLLNLSDDIFYFLTNKMAKA